MENLDLKEIRNKLDEIDTQLVGLFEKRMALCSDVAEFKIQTGKKVYDGPTSDPNAFVQPTFNLDDSDDDAEIGEGGSK